MLWYASLVNWVIYLEPDCILQTRDQISYYSDEKFDDRVIMTGNGFLPLLQRAVFRLKRHNHDYDPGSGPSVMWWSVMAQETEGERFQNIMINNSFHKWNYSWMCSFLVNWIFEGNHSHNCYVSGSRVIVIVFWVIIIFIAFISPWHSRARGSLMLAGCGYFVKDDRLFENADIDELNCWAGCEIKHARWR